MTHLTVKQAAARVGRTVRTIENWITAGLTTIHIGGRRYIDEQQLLTVYRARLQADPSRTRNTP